MSKGAFVAVFGGRSQPPRRLDGGDLLMEGGFDVYRKQITFGYMKMETGEIHRGKIRLANRESLREWLEAFTEHEVGVSRTLVGGAWFPLPSCCQRGSLCPSNWTASIKRAARPFFKAGSPNRLSRRRLAKERRLSTEIMLNFYLKLESFDPSTTFVSQRSWITRERYPPPAHRVKGLQPVPTFDAWCLYT